MAILAKPPPLPLPFLFLSIESLDEYFLRVSIQRIHPQIIPNVITARMVTRLSRLRIELSRAFPMLSAAISATVASYCRLPMTDNRSHDTGTPRLPESAITPRRIDTDGRTVNEAEDVIAFLKTFLSIPIASPAL